MTAGLLKMRGTHEATHMLRVINGLRSTLGLLSIGLGGEEPYEEGIAVVRERAFATKEKPVSISLVHMAICLGLGLETGTQLDFRQTFEVIWRLALLKELRTSKTKTADELKKEARADAYTACRDAFIGTQPHVPGFVHRGRMRYADGSSSFKADLANGLPPQIQALIPAGIGLADIIDVGKFNPRNEEQMRHLAALGTFNYWIANRIAR